MVAELVTFAHGAADELGPSLSVRAKYEEGRAHPMRRESVEDPRGRVGVWSVVESQSDFPPALRQLSQHRTEEAAVPVERAMRQSAEHRNANCRERGNHTSVRLGPSTAVYTSRMAAVTVGHP